MESALDTTVRLTGDCLALREQQRVQDAALRALRQVEREQVRGQAALEQSKRDRARDLARTCERRDVDERRYEQLQAQVENRCTPETFSETYSHLYGSSVRLCTSISRALKPGTLDFDRYDATVVC